MKLLDRLTNRGDLVALERGRLIIQSASGVEVPSSWLKTHSDELALALATRANTPLYKYIGYTVGSYTEHKADGVTLRFINMATGEEVYAVFNVNRTRVQTTARGKAGSKLRGNQFRVTRNMMLYKFWLRTGLPEPERKYLSEFHRVMGRLKQVFFTMSANNGKADKSTIQGVTLTGNKQGLKGGSTGERTGEEVGINGGKKEGKGNPANPYSEQVTDDFHYGSNIVRLKLTSKHVSKEALHPINTLNTPRAKTPCDEQPRTLSPQEQSIEEWLAELNS